MMQVTREEAVNFFLALGCKHAPEWDQEKLLRRLGTIHARITEEDVPAEWLEFFRKLRKEKDVTIVVNVPGVVIPEMEPGYQDPIPEPPRDRFGCRRGTIGWKVNKAMSTEWQTPEEIARKARVRIDQVMGRIRIGMSQGIYEKKKIVYYRLKEEYAVQDNEEV
jgi:hypothetical protein